MNETTGSFHPEKKDSEQAQLAPTLPPGGTPPIVKPQDTEDLLKTQPTAEPPAELIAVPGYEMQERLGRGGMGVVYKAKHLRLKRFVALKMVLAGAHASPEMRARFTKEAEALAKLKHPNIVQIYDISEHQQLPYISFEFMEGGSLEQRLRQERLSPRQAAELVRTLALAVDAAHQRGIIHRDLKPANILLTDDGTPKITDFGLAKHVDGSQQHTASGAIVGTPSYMAPEQAGGNRGKVGPHTDIWGLGAILYELLTGRPPFVSDSLIDTVLKVVSEEPTPPRQLQPDVPPKLEAICLRCLRKTATERFTSAPALAKALEEYLTNQQDPPTAEMQSSDPLEASTITESISPAKRVAWILFHALAVCFMVVVLYWVNSFHWTQERMFSDRSVAWLQPYWLPTLFLVAYGMMWAAYVLVSWFRRKVVRFQDTTHILLLIYFLTTLPIMAFLLVRYITFSR